MTFWFAGAISIVNQKVLVRNYIRNKHTYRQITDIDIYTCSIIALRTYNLILKKQHISGVATFKLFRINSLSLALQETFDIGNKAFYYTRCSPFFVKSPLSLLHRTGPGSFSVKVPLVI